METRKRFSLCNCKTISCRHGYFLDSQGKKMIPIPTISAREGKTWVNVFMENGAVTKEEALLLEEDILLSEIPSESPRDLTATIFNGKSNDDVCTIINKKTTINESGVHGDQEPWM